MNIDKLKKLIEDVKIFYGAYTIIDFKKVGICCLLFCFGSVALLAKDNQPLKVVTSWSILEDVTKNIGQEHIRVTSLAPRGIDLHDIKLTPKDQIRLRSAHLVIWLGLNLENWLTSSLKTVANEKQLEVGKHLSQLLPLYRTVANQPAVPQPNAPLHREEHTTAVNPHIWHDVQMIIRVSEIIADYLSTHDPAHATHYEENAEHYVQQLKSLHEWIHQKLSFIPKEQRLLVTGHNAFQYFGKAYGFQTLSPRGLTTHDQPSPWVLRHIIATLRQKKVRVLFIESGSRSSLLSRIGQEADIVIKAELISGNLDVLGQAGDTYIGLMQKNVKTIAGAFQDASTP